MKTAKGRSGKMHDENLIRALWNLRIIFLDKCVHCRSITD